jgi:hypothetical protein
MVINENSQCVNVREGACFVEEGRTNVVHRLLVVEDTLESEIKWVIHGCIKSIMSILGDISDVTVEDLSNLIDTCILSIFFPEWLFNMRDSINANTVKVKLLNGIFNPVKQSLADPSQGCQADDPLPRADADAAFCSKLFVQNLMKHII